jgi:hypothetical protein
VIKHDPKESIEFRILKYHFEYKLERYYSVAYVLISFCLFVNLMIYLRIVNFDKVLNIIDIYNILKTIFNTTPFIILFFNIILLFLFIYLLIMFIKVCKFFF